LEKFLSDLDVPEQTQKRAIGEVDSRGIGSISGVLMSEAAVEATWPKDKRNPGSDS
jgi:hypothetical protein